MNNFGDMLISFFVFVIVFGSILFLAYVTTKFIGNKSGIAAKGKHINIVETVSLGLDLKLHLVKIGDEFVVISASGKNVQMLTKVNMSEYFEEEVTNPQNPFDFKEIFEKYIQNFKGKQNGKGEQSSDEGKSIDNDNRFKSNLVRIRNITSNFGKQYNTGGDEKAHENQG